MKRHFVKSLSNHKKIKEFMKTGYKIAAGLLLKLSPVAGSKFIYRVSTGNKLDLKSPKTFDEKIQWLKLYSYHKDPLVARCTDKIAVRDYVKECGLDCILNELFAVYDDAHNIKWDDLPDQFAVKTTHGCGGNIICADKATLNIPESVTKLSEWLKQDFSSLSGELHYRNIKPRIIIEKYLSDGSGKLPVDFKIYCFNGKAKLVLVIQDRGINIKLNFFSLDWEVLHIGQKQFESDIVPERPVNFELFVQYADVLAKPFPFVRVDFYNISGQPVFGEMTFTPAAGVATYYNDEGQEYLGNLLDLSFSSLRYNNLRGV